MKNLFSRHPLFIVLLPIFYVLNTLNLYFPLLRADDFYNSASLLILGIHVVILVIFIARPRYSRYALLLLYLSIVYLFFGSILASCKKVLPFLAHFKFILPFQALCALIIFMILKRSKKNSFPVAFLYLNLLLVIFNVIEAGRVLIKNNLWLTNQLSSKVTSDPVLTTAICDTCVKPDVYFIVFDGYAGQRSLQEYWDFSNNSMDTFFRKEGFFYARNSSSNYNFTPFSLGSILNMDYHQHPPSTNDLQEFCRGTGSISQSKVIELLISNGYSIVNNSCFPLPLHDAALDINFTANPTSTLLSQTLPARFSKDVLWNFGMGTSDFIERRLPLSKLHLQQIFKAEEQLLHASATEQQGPAFVYTHFLLPHDPYFFDSTGQRTPDSLWFRTEGDKAYYLSQLKYCNTLIKKMVHQIKHTGARPRVIILVSDHGYRALEKVDPKQYQYNNLFAIYYPDGEYSAMYDHISTVNTFPLLFNKYFKAKIPLQKDSTIFSYHDVQKLW
ncbi:sulfatase-like hydrolase/transferase [Paraflavitalea pollutisoli]|uniref:sulfatase-like hydrolase/transferase n=1 Tax=Paraflavitalea pollutisoli TaxID=3034143 RepID=UPI0023EC2166|nr:sulfatase-like hydrolase/transferase [Paraflavitalea sp. H1-2-19X]